MSTRLPDFACLVEEKLRPRMKRPAARKGQKARMPSALEKRLNGFFGKSLDVEAFDPGLQGSGTLGSVQKLALDDGAGRSHAALDSPYGLAKAAAAGCGEKDYGFAREIVGFEEGIDDGGSNVPPDRETQENDVVVFHMGIVVGNGGPEGRVPHFHGCTGCLVVPVQVRPAVGNLGLDFVQVATAGFGQLLRNGCCRALGAEIGNQLLAHEKVPCGLRPLLQEEKSSVAVLFREGHVVQAKKKGG